MIEMFSEGHAIPLKNSWMDEVNEETNTSFALYGIAPKPLYIFNQAV